MHATPKRFVLGLLSTVRDNAMPAGALVTAGALFGISENNMRVTLARLRAARLIDQDEQGRYRLAEAAAAVDKQVTAWRSIEQRVRKWDGGWIAVHTGAVRRSERRAHRHNDRAIRLLGFESYDAGLHLRPDNLVGGVEAVRQDLHALGLHRHAMVFHLRDLDAAAERRARSLWNTAALRAGYRSSLAALQRSERRLPGLPAHETLVESFVLGGRVLRQIVLDPLLPEPLVPADERRALVAAMRRYDDIGRSYWASFLKPVLAAAPSRKRRTQRRRPGQAEAA